MTVSSAATALRLFVLALLVTAFPLGAARGAAAAPAPYPKYLPPCKPIVVIGVRGSGQGGPKSLTKKAAPPEPSETPVKTVIEQLRALVGPVAGPTMSVIDLPYPAIPVKVDIPDWIPSNPWTSSKAVDYLSYEYDGSRQDGESTLELYLNVLNIQCPGASFVLVGYSQGADVIGDQLPRLQPQVRQKIAGVALFGDPRFNPTSRAVKSTFDANRSGMRGARPEFPSEVPVVSFCRYRDVVCQGLVGWELHTSGSLVTFTPVTGSKEPHMKYHEKEAAEAAQWLRTRLAKRNLLVAPVAAPSSTPLDLSFVIDSTGSMDDAIASVRDNVNTIRTELASQSTSFRAALSEYRDEPEEDSDFQARRVTDLTPDAAPFQAALDGLDADGGGDTAESMFAGINEGLAVSWRPEAAKALVVVADAEAKDPEPITGTTRADVIRRANLLGVPIHTMLVDDGSAKEDLVALAAGTVGTSAEADDPKTVAEKILATLRARAGAPIASTSGVALATRGGRRLQQAAAPIVGYPGVPVRLSAGSATSPVGEDLAYAWDFGDGQGATVTTPVVSHTWAAPFTGDVTLTVTDALGRSTRILRPVVIAGAAPPAVSAPRKVRTKLRKGRLTVSWKLPTSGSAVAYSVMTGETILRTVTPKNVRKEYAIKLDDPPRCRSLRIRVVAVDTASRTATSTRARSTKVPPKRGTCARRR